MKDRRFALAAFMVFIALFAGIYFFIGPGRASNATNDIPSESPTPGSTTNTGSNANGGSGADGPANSGNRSNAATTGVTVPREFQGGKEEWRAAFANLIEAQNRLFQNPDPAGVGRFMDPSCACYQETVDGMTDLKKKGWRVNGTTTEIKAMALVGQSGSNYTVVATFAGGGGTTVDKNNKVTEPASRATVPPIRFTLTKQTNGSWVISDRRPIQEGKK